MELTPCALLPAATTDTTTETEKITTDKTQMAPAIKTRPVDKDGNPLEGAKVTLQCNDPQGEFAAVEDPAGEYTFMEGIPGDGRIQCDLVVEKEGYVNFSNLE